MRAYLHIGIGKTGTSAIQKLLYLNPEPLADQGAYYPYSLGRFNARQIRLGAYALRDDLYTDPRKVLGINADNLADFRREFEGLLDAEIKKMPPGIDKVIFSDEGLCSLTTPAELRRLRALLDPYFEQIDVIVYLRRQDMHSVSQHSQHLKAGRLGRKILRASHYYDFAGYLDLWAREFGEAQLHPRIFERARFQNGDVLSDFLDVCGLEYTGAFTKVGVLNPSLTPEASVFLDHLNKTVKKFSDGRRNKGRALVVRHLLSEFPGSGLRPARAEAERFYAKYAAMNEAARARWFPGQTSLFDESFDVYPREAHGQTLAAADLMAISGSVINRMADEITTQMEENAQLRGEDADFAEAALNQRDLQASVMAMSQQDAAPATPGPGGRDAGSVPAPVIFQCGIAKSGNFWLYAAIQKLLAAAGADQRSFIQQQPIYQQAKDWALSFPEQASIDVLDITPQGYVTRISSRFEQGIGDLDAYLAEATHVWSHSAYRAGLSDAVFQRVNCMIYIVRDPRDVLLSMADFVFTPYMRQHFPTAHDDRDAFLAERIESFPAQWAGHVKGYLEASPMLGIHILTYEEMRRDLTASLGRLAGWMGLTTLTEADLEALAVSLSFDAMRGSRPGHVNQGRAERWRSGLTAEQNASVIAAAGGVMSKMGYALD